jgi:hypothetical protein
MRNPYAVQSMIVLSLCAATSQAQVARISGQVQDEAGSQLPGACVQVRTPGTTEALSAVRTDDAGKFTLVAKPADAYELFFQHSGFRRRSLRIATSGNVIVVPPMVLQISNSVVDFMPPSVEELEAYHARVYAEGTLVAHESCGIDLDTGGLFCPAGNGEPAEHRPTKGYDVWLRRDKDGFYLDRGQGVTLRRCDDPKYHKAPIRIDAPPGGSVCVLTDQGRRALLFVQVNEPACIKGEMKLSFETERH